ncbi:calcium-binding protein [Sphingobium sp. DEHP117]|uniref:beta strand repeat-containing protein n=1 Tax=Sphingobium sp. DEHP117 TaxID=2993436 RepID=UPI0027D4BD01|nr:calcium-binding protein [Sphingobium sp. DEHP117]MDQ4418966.1 calcium-binding protein [Sphingobium sp. DEHP117]
MGTFTGTTGNDTLNGSNGDDTLDGGRGVDVLNGNDGNDVFLLDAVDGSGTGPYDQFNGGNGTDTLQLQPSPLVLTGPYTPVGLYLLQNATFSSIEGIDFNSTVTSARWAILTTTQIAAGFSSNLQLKGGAGSDVLVLTTGAAGSYTMPSFTKTNWTIDTTVNGLPTLNDSVVLQAVGTGNYTLHATDVHTGLEALAGSNDPNGRDTLLGGSSQDVLIATAGNDTLSGGGGNDFFNVINSPSQFNTYSTSSFDGGTGIDTMSFGGYVNFLGTVSSIEQIRLLPPQQPSNLGASFQATILDITETVADQFNVGLIEGTGSIWYTMEGNSFDASPIQIAAGSAIDFEVYGTSGNDNIIGSATTDYLYGDIGNDTISGGAGDDILEGDDGNDVLTGGSGNDIFAASYGNDTIMDFTIGQDLIAVPDVVANFDMLKPFLSQVGADTVLSFPYGGVQHSLTIKNTQLASLSQASFIASGGSSDDPGTGSDDTYFGSDFGDLFDGTGGNDLIFAGAGGPDQITGGTGNDTIVVTGSEPSVGAQGQPILPFANSSFDGGTGTDTLRISAFGIPTQDVPPLYTVDLKQSTISGFEQLQFEANAGTMINVYFTMAQITNNAGLTVTGSVGQDIVIINAPTSGTFAMPNITRNNWSLDLTPATSSSQVLNSDIMVLSANGSSGSTLQANTNHSGVEYLFSISGNDILLGGNDTEFLNGGVSGADQLSGGGGTDVMIVSEIFSAIGQGNYSDDSFDGGTGIDYLQVTGNVSFAGTLTNVEGIWLVPAAVSSNPSQPSFNDAQLTIDAAHAAAFGANALLRGKGSVIVNATSAGTTDLSGWQFETAPITVTINGSTGNDTIKGTSHADTLSGGDGDDRVYWDATDNGANITGGAGIDRLVIKDGIAIPSFNYAAQGFELLEIETNDNAGNQNWSRQIQTYNLSLQLVDYSTLYDDNSRVSVVLDPGNANGTAQVVSYYDTLDRLVQVDQVNDDASRVIFNYDPANASALASQGLYFDSQNRFDLWDQLYDDGRHVIINYDQANASSLSSEIIYYDAQARLDLWDRYFDDGSHQVINYDEANVDPLSSELITYDTQGRLDLWDRYLDNGSRVLINYDQANATAFSVDLVYYDSQSRIDLWDQNYDNGSRVVIDYDQANASALSSSLVYYDNQGRLDRWDQNYDDGSRVVIDYDQANASNLANELLYFDTQARIDLWDRNYDDGSRILVDFDQDNTQSWNQHVLTYNTQGTLVGDVFV